MEIVKYPKDRSRSIRFIILMYYISGGMYISDELSNRIKFTWICMNISVLTLCVLGGVGYFITVESVNLWDFSSIIWVTTGTVFAIIIIPLATSSYDCNFKTLFDFLERNSIRVPHGRSDVSTLSIRWTEPVSSAISWFILAIFVSLLLILTPAINMIIFRRDNDERIHNIQYHLVGIPYVDRIPSVTIFSGIYIIEAVLMSFPLFLAFCGPLLIITLAHELKNIVVDYCEEMKTLSKLLVDKIEKSRKGFDYEGTEFALMFDNFENQLQVFIRRYQQLIRAIQLIKSYEQTFSTAVLFIVFIELCISALVFLLTDFEVFLKLKLLFASALAPIYLYPHCQFGTIHDAMNDAIFQQIYNLPWYYLPPRKRKMVHIFLNQARRPIIFKAFGTFPVNLSLFPKVLRLMYSFINVLAATFKSGRR